jgi:deferrochelatase/peroxidase EfeB
MAPITRRRLLASAGAGAAGLGLGAGGYLIGRETAEADDELLGAVPFYGEHQAGIATPAQDRLHFASFDLSTERRAELRELMREWSRAAAEMCAGRLVGDVNGLQPAPPQDTGETIDLSPANLTLTFGFGPSLFEKRGLRLHARRPSALKPIPPLPADELNELESGGDLCVQACSDDPQVAFHAIRNLARIGRGTVVMRWSQLGFGRTSTTSGRQETRRNLLGFREGTNNIRAEDTETMRSCVWLGARDRPAWMRGGTYMVTRRIRMLLEIWDRSSLEDQERAIGRTKYSGAPLGSEEEADALDLSAIDGGKPVIPDRAHVRLAFSIDPEERILRRGYSFTDGVDPRLGELEAGTFFVCFQRDPARQFVAIQRRLATSADALNKYLKHVGSAVFAVPPGARRGGFVGEGLFA